MPKMIISEWIVVPLSSRLLGVVKIMVSQNQLGVENNVDASA